MATANLRFTFGAMLIGCFISVSCVFTFDFCGFQLTSLTHSVVRVNRVSNIQRLAACRVLELFRLIITIETTSVIRVA